MHPTNARDIFDQAIIQGASVSGASNVYQTVSNAYSLFVLSRKQFRDGPTLTRRKWHHLGSRAYWGLANLVFLFKEKCTGIPPFRKL